MKNVFYSSQNKNDSRGRVLNNSLVGVKQFFEEVDVCIFTEGTYPYVKGGVSSVIHQIIENIPDTTFGIVYIGWDRNFDHQLAYNLNERVKWVFPVFLSDQIQNETFMGNVFNFFKNRPKMDMKYSDFIHNLKKSIGGNEKELRDLYMKYFNPLTRKLNIKDILNDKEFFNFLIAEFSDLNISLNDFFWMKKEFISLAIALLDKVYPKALVYHSHSSGYAGFAASMASIQNDVPFLLTEHSLYTQDVLESLDKSFATDGDLKKRAWELWFKNIGRLNYSRCSANTFLYDKISLNALEYGAFKDKITIIPNGVNYEKFKDVREAQSKRDEIRFKENHIWKIGFIGRVVPVKDVVSLIYVIAELIKLSPKLKFSVDLIGPTDEDQQYFKECKDLVQRLNLEKVILFKGVCNVFDYLPSIDLILLTSKSEAFPMVVLEGMASSIPLISTNVGSVHNILQKELLIQGQAVGEAGITVTIENPAQFAKKIIEVLGEKDNYIAYKKNGPMRIKHFFQLKQVVGSYQKLYRSMRELT